MIGRLRLAASLLAVIVILAACGTQSPAPQPGRPSVSASTPANGATGVTRDVAPEAYLSLAGSAIDPATVNETSVSLVEVDGDAVDGTVTFGADGRTITFTPALPLAATTEYVFLLTDEIADEAGKRLLSSAIRFTTGTEFGVYRPEIVPIFPLDGETDVFRDTSVNNRFDDGNVGVDEATVTSDSVYLERAFDGALVAGTLTVSGGDDSIIFQPIVPLDPFTTYTFHVTAAVEDKAGRPFAPHQRSFTTDILLSVDPAPVSFDRATVFELSGDALASLLIGPDGLLYGSSVRGVVFRWPILEDGTLDLASQETYAPAILAGRPIIGMAFEPGDGGKLWITHNDPLPAPGDEAADFTGAIARIQIDEVSFSASTHDDVIVSLPRSVLDHLTNSLAFDPDGALYVTQGSNSSNGAADNTWGNRPERLLTAAMLRIDTEAALAVAPLDVQTEDDPASGTSGDYDPYAPGAPLTLYATGIRNAYDFVFHSNGRLYAPGNGGNGGNTPASPDGATPEIPALFGVPTQPDFLHEVNEGGYYGHPNPLRGEYVLNGGNPTAGDDGNDEVAASAPGEDDGYEVGIEPPAAYGGNLTSLGLNASANGTIEYLSGRFGGALLNQMLIARYTNGDIRAFEFDLDGALIGDTVVATGLERPLDLAENQLSGDLYVIEFQGTFGSRVTLLRAQGGE